MILVIVGSGPNYSYDCFLRLLSYIRKVGDLTDKHSDGVGAFSDHSKMILLAMPAGMQLPVI